MHYAVVGEDHGYEMFRQLPFPFEGDAFPAELGVVVQKTVLSGELAALEVTHTSDNSWLVGDGVNDPNEPGACIATHISHVIESNSSIAALASLPLGYTATREAARAEWMASPHVWPDAP